MKRGDIVTVALQGELGKPRPAVIVQSDLVNDIFTSLTLCPITSTLSDTPSFRITVEPSRQNGLKKLSQIMVDKVQTRKREKVTQRIGSLETEAMQRLTRSLILHMDLF